MAACSSCGHENRDGARFCEECAASLSSPARVVAGLVYVPAKQGFGFHMWNEVLIRGQWIPLDGTLGRGGIGGAHLKLSDTNLKDGSASASFWPGRNRRPQARF